MDLDLISNLLNVIEERASSTLEAVGRMRKAMANRLSGLPLGVRKGASPPAWMRRLPSEFRRSDVEKLAGISQEKAGQVIAGWRRKDWIGDVDYGVHRVREGLFKQRKPANTSADPATMLRGSKADEEPLQAGKPAPQQTGKSAIQQTGKSAIQQNGPAKRDALQDRVKRADPAIAAAMVTKTESAEDRWRRIRGEMGDLTRPEPKLKGEE